MLKQITQKPERISEEISIVMVGDFNPKIFQPSWFALQGLIRESEADAAPVEIVHSDFTSFSTDWFSLQVTRERLNLVIKSAAYKSHLSDLANGTFQHLLHTPITQMGINVNSVLRFKSLPDWDAFGHFLAPKSAWNGILKSPGMRSIAIQGERDDKSLPGFKIITTEPIIYTASDATLRINNHYERPADNKDQNASFFISVIENEFDKVIDESFSMIDALMTKFNQQTDFDNGKD